MVLSGPYVSVMENPTLEEIAREVIDCAYHIHVELGPGLLESVYEVVLAKALEERGYRVVRQVPIKIQFRDLKFDEGFRADLIVNDCFLIELKSVEKTSPVHAKQTLTYLRLLKFPPRSAAELRCGYAQRGSPTHRESTSRRCVFRTSHPSGE
ncbi:MAG: GxxExxY protein [Verrucomicrobiales bacterium]|jgi:GxxExxY protein|nr:GxxExxY protein [Verrucomicrobiales bacterium]